MISLEPGTNWDSFSVERSQIERREGPVFVRLIELSLRRLRMGDVMRTRYFEYVGADERRGTDASKFWEVTVAESTLTIRFGKIGANGQTKVTEFGSTAEAESEADKLVASKVKKGYVEKDV